MRKSKINSIITFLAAIVALEILSCTCTLADKPVIYYVDLRYTENLSKTECYDIRHTAVCLQGLVNRESPRVYISFYDNDVTWLDRIRETGGFCEGWEVRTITFQQLFKMFRHYINGLVLYDSDPDTGAKSTSLVATTVAGVEGGIALRKDATSTTYDYLVNTLAFPVIVDLAGKFTGSGTIWGTSTASTGSAKCDAYIWAKQNYLDTGECDPTVLMYTLDLVGIQQDTRCYSQLFNLDYAVSKKAFCFELSPWGDEKPSDDLTQPLGTDLSTLKAILDACNTQTGKNQFIRVCGYTNWPLKYTNYESVGGSHTPVETEWQFTSILSAYNACLEADAPSPSWVMNTSFFAGLLPGMYSRHYVQNPPPTYDDMVSRGLITSTGSVPSGNYVMIGLGDYDNASWVTCALANYGGAYDDTNKQYVCCNWGVDPNAIERASVAMDYMYRHKTSNDFFVAWDSGAGYINPAQLYGTRSPSGYSSGVGIWQKHCSKYYRFLDYSITAWLLDGNSATTSTSCSNYTRFSGDGIGVWSTANFSTPCLNDNAPVNRGYDYTGSIINYSSGVRFRWYRMPAFATATDLQAIQANYTSNNHHFLDAYTYNYLLRYYLGGSNNYRETWVDETTPRIMASGQTYSVAVTARNDGWDTWSQADAYSLAYAIVNKDATPVYADYDSRGRWQIPSGSSIAPGQSVTFTVNVVAPSTPGTYDLYYDMVHDGHTYFWEQNNLECKKTITVVDDPTSIDTDSDGTPDVTEEADGTLYWHAGDKYTLGPTSSGAPVGVTSSSTVTFNWAAFSDSHYNVAGYYCQIGTSPGGSDIYNEYLENALTKTITGCTHATTYYCRVQAINDAGYLSEWSDDSNGVIVDTGPTGSITINSGDKYANSTAVTLTLSAVDSVSDVAQMRFANSGSPFSEWETYSSSKSWTLSSTEGTGVVYVQFKSASGSVSTNYSDSIILDTQPPTTPGMLTDPGTFTNNTSLAFSWTASTDSRSGLAGYNCQIGTVPGANNIFDGYLGNVLSKTIVGSIGCVYYCRVQSKDNAGNVSAWVNSDGIVVAANMPTSINFAKLLQDSTSVGLSAKVVTAVFGDCFYVEEINQTSGIKVVPGVMPSGLSIGQSVDIGGIMRTGADGERFIDGCALIKS
ncbi:MAG: GxGYxYP domain-containing protein [Armatimonadota bacterium]|nr:hypothetical protein [bacterium]